MFKPDLQFSLICDDVRIEHNGKFILIGLFDNIAAQTTPVIHKKFVVVNRWGKGEGTFSEETRIIHSQSNKVIAKSNRIKFTLRNMDTLHNVLSEFKNVRFPEEGKYWIEVLLDNELVRSFNFYVHKIRRRSAPQN